MPSKPPTISAWPFRGSVNIIGRVTGVGFAVGLACVQVCAAPSQIQVSPRYCEPLKPPNMTIFLSWTSYDIAAAVRAGGATGGFSCTQVLFLKIQVSFL